MTLRPRRQNVGIILKNGLNPPKDTKDVQKVSHNKYHFLPYLAMTPHARLMTVLRTKPSLTLKKRETKTHPTGDQDNHSTKAMPDNHTKNLTKKAMDISLLSATLQDDKRKQNDLRPSTIQGILELRSTRHMSNPKRNVRKRFETDTPSTPSRPT